MSDYNNIKAGLTNYAGALICALETDEKSARHQVAATLIEEAMNLIKNDDESIDIFVAKPLLRATVIILNDRIKNLKNLNEELQDEKVYSSIEKYNYCVNSLNNLIDSVKK